MATQIAAVAEPAANGSLLRRFPTLPDALDGDAMCEQLQQIFFAGTPLSIAECGRPKAEIGERSCAVLYALRVRAPSGDVHDALVLGTVFADTAEAADFEQRALAPLAAASRHAVEHAARATGTIPALGLALSVYPVSAAHPTLARAADAVAASAALRRLLGDGAAQVNSVELIRLRRSRGCVLRYRVEHCDHAVVYAKVGYPAAGPASREGFMQLSRHGCTVSFPSLLGRDGDLEADFVSELPGAPPDLKAEAERERAVAAAASAAAELHGLGVTAGELHTLADEIHRASEVVRLVARDEPSLADWLTTILDVVSAADARIRRQPVVLSHGSFAPSQLMLDGPRTGLLDFDRLCQAEPAFDLGRFVAPLRVTLARVGRADADAAAGAFLIGYEVAAGRPADEERVALYEVAALVRTCAHSWLQLKTSRLQKAAEVIRDRSAALGLAA